MGQERTITIPAKVGNRVGKNVETISGKIFTCISATAACFVQPDMFGKFSVSTGRSLGNEHSPGFSRLTFYNTSASDITVNYYAGDEPYTPDAAIAVITPTVSTLVKDASTYTKATNCPANATTTFNGLDVAQQRKQFAVMNMEATGGAAITVTDNAGVGFEIDPREKFTMETNGIFKVTVAAGVAAAKVIETFYS